MKNIIILVLGVFMLSAYPNYDLSLEDAKSRAKEQNIPYLVNVYADWCVVCKHMEETSLSDSRVQQQINDYYEYTKIDLESADGQLFAVQHNIQTLPAIFIFDPNEKVLYSAQRAHSVQDFMTILNRYKKGKKAPTYQPANKPVTSSKRVVITHKSQEDLRRSKANENRKRKKSNKKKSEKIYSWW